jgi:small redox-active disulfide protein 2
MPEDNVMQIRINNNLVGIVGLERVMEEMAGEFAHRPDGDIGAEMVQRLSNNNYIPMPAKGSYAVALVHEFKKYIGQPVDDQPVAGLRIAVLGPGCSQCSRMEMDVREVLAEMKLPAELLHVTDVREIGKYGVMGVPALVINDRVVCVGKTPHRKEIKEWLEESVSSDKKERPLKNGFARHKESFSPER